MGASSILSQAKREVMEAQVISSPPVEQQSVLRHRRVTSQVSNQMRTQYNPSPNPENSVLLEQ
jgi:hypothetical protein